MQIPGPSAHQGRLPGSPWGHHMVLSLKTLVVHLDVAETQTKDLSSREGRARPPEKTSPSADHLLPPGMYQEVCFL